MTDLAAQGCAANIMLSVAWFPTAMPSGPAIGDPERISWPDLSAVLCERREGEKDGCCFATARFKFEPDGRHVRRLKANVEARTAVALDCEMNKVTGEVPPPLTIAVERIRATGWAAVIYTSHSHSPAAPRFRILLPLTEEIAPDLPVVEVVAERLQLRGVLDESKLGASSLFYAPSMPYDADERDHAAIIIQGDPVAAAWMRHEAGVILAARQAEADRKAAQAHAEAAARRDAKIAAGFDPDDSLIEKLRSRFDLRGVLLSHGYSQAGTKFRHANSSSGSYGADIKTFGGIERVFSHNGTDPLHAANLPDWCGGVTALDVIDVVTILDYGGDRAKALAALAVRFDLTNAAERKAVAALIFRLIRQQAPQEEIEREAYAEGERRGMSRADVIRVAQWVATQTKREAA